MSIIDLWKKVEEAYRILNHCQLCPRDCKVNRLKGERGYCGQASDIYISSYGPHFGEEPELVGRFGSGTIFLTGCSLKCAFCQNYDISHLHRGWKVELDELVKIMLALEKQGCHNINFVTPTHYSPQIMKAILLAREKGLSIPIVYNCGGYDKKETLRLLEGFIDIYMPDAKFIFKALSLKYCHAEDYAQVMPSAILEMHRQVGDLIIKDGLAKKGLLIRHLVMPGGLENAKKVFEFIACKISKNTYLNIMEQYYPCYRAFDYPEISSRLEREEYLKAIEIAKEYGLWRGF